MTRGTRYGWNVSGRRAICAVSALQELVLYNLPLTFRIVFRYDRFLNNSKYPQVSVAYSL